MRHVVLFALVGLTGCILPMRTGAPLPATTVGKGNLGVAVTGEGPMIAPVADNTANGTISTDRFGQGPTATTSVTLAMGITDDTDVEVAAEGAMLLPLGASVGLRHHLGASGRFDFAIAARLGGVWSGAATDANGDRTSTDDWDIYAGVEGVAQRQRGTVRPLLALELMPFRIADSQPDQPVQRIEGLASSLTFGVDFVLGTAQIEPYVTLSDVASDHVAGGAFVTGGLMLALRPHPHASAPLPSSAPPPG